MRSITIVLLCACLGMPFFAIQPTAAQEEWERISTLWHSPGFLTDLSPDGQYVGIYNRPEGIKRLVQVATGEVLEEIEGNPPFQFSPDSTLVYIYHNNAEAGDLINLPENRKIVAITNATVYYSPDSQWLFTIEDERTYLWNTRTGQLMQELTGEGQVFSEDSRWLVIGQARGAAQIVDVVSGNKVFEFCVEDSHSLDTTYGQFTPDSGYLALESSAMNATLFYQTQDWTLQYQAMPYLELSPDHRYFIEEVRVDPLVSQIVELATGEVIATVEGKHLFFSPDGRHYFSLIEDEAGFHYEIFAFDSHERIAALDGELQFAFNPAETQVAVFDVSTQRSDLLDLMTGETMMTLDGQATFLMDDWLWVRPDTSVTPGYLYHVPSQSRADAGWEFHSAGDYLFISNGAYVDVYGQEREKSMLPPRIGQGGHAASRLDLRVYDAPNGNLIWEEPVEGFTVLGKTSSEWLYISYDYPRIKLGWIEPQNVAMINLLQTAPLVEVDDPLGSLQRIAEEGG